VADRRRIEPPAEWDSDSLCTNETHRGAAAGLAANCLVRNPVVISSSARHDQRSNLVLEPGRAPRRILTFALNQRAKMLLTKDSLLVDEKRRWQRAHSVVLSHLTIIVEQDEHPQPELLPERFDRRGILLKVHLKQREPLALEIVRHVLERRHLASTWNTPRSPEVEDNYLPSLFGKIGCATVKEWQVHLRRGRSGP
jgi:hypothetical protein